SAKRSLIAALAEGLEHGSDPVAATRIWSETSYHHEGNAFGDLGGVNETEDEPGFLEQLADMESGITDMNQTLVRGTSILEEIAAILNSGAIRINSLPMIDNYSSSKLAAA